MTIDEAGDALIEMIRAPPMAATPRPRRSVTANSR
jgi:hypothetical protein